MSREKNAMRKWRNVRVKVIEFKKGGGSLTASGDVQEFPIAQTSDDEGRARYKLRDMSHVARRRCIGGRVATTRAAAKRAAPVRAGDWPRTDNWEGTLFREALHSPSESGALTSRRIGRSAPKEEDARGVGGGPR